MLKTRFCRLSMFLVATLVCGMAISIVAAQNPPENLPVSPEAPARVNARTVSQEKEFTEQVLPLLERYCYQCHGNGEHKADFAMDKFRSPTAIAGDRERWQTVIDYLRSSEMPPPEAKSKPTLAERETIISWVEGTLFPVDPNNPDPGRVTIRRLNRTEYSNTIRDLLGVDFEATEDFPADDLGYGFDNIGDVLSISPVLMEKYLAAATRILDEAVATEAVVNQNRHYQANLMEYGFNADGDDGDGWMPLSPLEEDGVAMRLPVSQGDYLIRALAYANIRRGNAEDLILTVMLDNTVTHEWHVTQRSAEEAGVYEARIGVPAGRHRITVLNRRLRGGDDELLMKNGRMGREQAGNVMVKWVEIEGPLGNTVQRVPADAFGITGESEILPDGARLLDHNTEVGHRFSIPEDGEQIIRVQANARQAGYDFAKMEVRIDGDVAHTFEVRESDTLVPIEGQRVFSIRLLDRQPWVYEFQTNLTAGEHVITAAFVNDFADPGNENPNLRDRSLLVDHIEVSTPGAVAPLPAPPAPMLALFQGLGEKRDREAGRTVLQRFARRAWRRPVRDDEINRIMQLFDLAANRGESFNVCIKVAMKAVMVSPKFLFRGELQPEPDNPLATFPIDEHELASRLSYFLWSSMPDEELFALADRGELRGQLDAQVRRMLASDQTQALVENFAGQWLEIRNLKALAPDRDLFPAFDDDLRQSMAQETRLLFQSIMRDDRSLLDLLTSTESFINERLARHYGIEGVTGEEFRPVNVADAHRAGILTHASILTLTSNPTRTSPVKRGKWVLENLLGTPPPPPPPDVPDLEQPGVVALGTLREQMEQHRANPACSSCHARMDPIGFALENFDGIGSYREKEGAAAIDSSGQLVSGEEFHGPLELGRILATSKRPEFIRCVTEKMLTYALGRGMEYYDRPAVDGIVREMEENEFHFSALIAGIVDSVPFQQRRGDGDRRQTASTTP